MRIVSIVIFALAILLGAVAVVGVRGLIAQNQNVTPIIAQPEVTSTVVVARQALEFGSELTPETLREIPWASTERPEGSFATVNEILNGERRVALRSIAPGELVLKDRISGFGGRATLSQIIQDGMRATTLRVNDVSGAGGFVLPGDRVDVLLTVMPTGDRLDAITNVLLEDVRVLAIDQVADDSSEGAIVAKAATLEVEPEDAQRIALASEIGSLSLTLRNLAVTEDGDADEDKKPNRTIRYRDLGPQSSPTVATRGPVAPSPYTTMRVIRGTQPSNASVLKDRNQTSSLSSAPALAGAGQNLATTTATRLSAPAGDE
jgi:pilus assembly protein CpaB